MKKYLRSFYYLLFSCGLSLLLAGCLSPVTPEKDGAYLIKSVPHNVAIRKQTGRTILVMPPNTVPMYNTRSMAYSNSPYKISYYAKNYWAETPSEMLMPLIVKTLQKTHHYRAVVSAPYTGRYHYLLTTDIIELLQDFTDCKQALKFGMRAQLSDGTTGHILRVKDFSRTLPMCKKDPYAGVLAANQAVAEVLRELAEWLV